MPKKLRVGVVGATGYTGEELVRLLSAHPHAELAYASGRQERDTKLQELFPSLRGRVDIPCGAFQWDEALRHCDLVFLSLPHTVSMEFVPRFLKEKKKVIDVSADYRLKDVSLYAKYYKVSHKDPANLRRAVYGLPEFYRDRLRGAKLVANPGCYPTGALLGILPGVKRGLFGPGPVVIDAKSGVTGAGRKADKALNFSEVNESLKAYKIFEHQHVPEIGQELERSGGRAADVIFVPHLLPVNRGILSTIYVRLKGAMGTEEFLSAYQKFYEKEPFVTVLPAGTLPELKQAAHSNVCLIGARADAARKMAVIVTAIDNLGKGAAGQAVQNMNILSGFDETAGL